MGKPYSVIKELRDSFNEHLRSNQILGETSESLNQILQTLNENTELLKQIDGTLKGSIEELNKDTAKQAKEIKDTIEKGVESLNQTLKEELKLE